jgi:hypothetical protein
VRNYDFLKKHNLLKKSMFHLSDEPHGEEHMKNYRAFRKMLAELAPWMKVMDAISEIDYVRAGLTDMPVASENVVMDFIKDGIPCWVYYCCGPRGKFLNHLMDTPLAKIAMHGLLFYRWKLSGFLHWGYNFWYKRHTTQLIDPFAVNDAGAWPYWPHGDTFLVYPGENGPIDSIRWEVFSLSMQDYALLETLEIDRDDKCLADLRSFEDFPKDPNWLLNLRKNSWVRNSGMFYMLGCMRRSTSHNFAGIMEHIKPDYIYTDGGIGGGGDRLDYSDYSVPQALSGFA